MADKNYDLVIIGGGPGGYRAGEFAAHAGLKACVIEKGNLGGVCLNVGCIPTKALLKSAKVAKYIKDSLHYGIETDAKSIKIVWEKMQERKNEVVKKLVNGVDLLLKGNKVDVIKGEAKLVDKNTLTVNDDKITFKNLLISTGSVPVILPLPGFDEAYKAGRIIDSTGALSLKKLPKTLTVIGGGVIGIEFAVLYAELGTKVTIVQGLDTILEKLDKDISTETAKILAERGITVLLNTKVTGYDVKNDCLLVEGQDGKKSSLKADHTLISVGRRPITINADKIGVAIDKRGSIIVDNQQRTNIPHIFAAGDCCSPLMLAHVAYKQASIVINNIVGKKEVIDFNKIPSCIYSFPEVAVVGRTEEELTKANIQFVKAKLPIKIIGKAIADGEENIGFIKMLVDPKYGEILGCHIIASTASDMIAEVATLMEIEATVFDLARAIHPHPTISEMVGDVAIEATYRINAQRKRAAA